jgi:hypothetical protein
VVPVYPLQYLLGLLGVLTPQEVRIPDLAAVTFEIDIDWPFGFAFDEDEIESGEPDPGAKIGTGHGTGITIGKGAFGLDHPSGEALGHGSCQGADGDDELVLRPESVYARLEFLIEIADA